MNERRNLRGIVSLITLGLSFALIGCERSSGAKSTAAAKPAQAAQRLAASVSAAGNPVSRWATSTGNAATDKARMWVAKQAGMRVNIERGNAWSLGDFASGTNSYSTLKSQGVVGVRLFFPWRYSVDMTGSGLGVQPPDSQLNAFLDSVTNALQAGLYVHFDMMDVVGTQDTFRARDGGATTERHLNRFGDLIAARLPQWDLNKIVIGPVNEWEGEENATYYDVFIKYHNIVRAKLGPNVIIAVNSAYWGDPSRLDDSFRLPADSGPMMVQLHTYLWSGSAKDQSAWKWIQDNALAWSDSHGGIPVTLGEGAMGDWSSDPGSVLTNPANQMDVIVAMGQGAPELRPAYWAITRVGTYFYVNNNAGTLLTSPNLVGSFLTASAAIKTQADAPTGDSPSPTPTPVPTPVPTPTPAPATAVNAIGVTAIDARATSAVSGFQADATGAAFNWGFMSGAGAYLEYALNVPAAQSFTLNVKYATSAASSIDVLVDGVKAASTSLPATGTWFDVYTDSPSVTVKLPKGTSVKLRVVATSAQPFNVSGLQLTAIPVPTPTPTPTPTPAPTPAPTPVPSTGLTGTSALVSKLSSKCVENPGSATTVGLAYVQRTCTSGANQSFVVTNVSGGLSKIVNRASGLCLDWGNGLAGTPLRQRACVATRVAQQFRLTRDSSGAVSVATSSGTMCAAIRRASTADGAVIELAACKSEAVQLFTASGLMGPVPTPTPTPAPTPAPTPGQPLSVGKATFRTFGNTYFRATNGGGSTMDAAGSAGAADTQFELFKPNGVAGLRSGDQVFLRGSNNRHHVMANCGGGTDIWDTNCGVLVAYTIEPLGWETFTIEKVGAAAGAIIATGDRVSLKAFNGRYCSALNGGGENVNCSSTWVLDWESFTVTLGAGTAPVPTPAPTPIGSTPSREFVVVTAGQSNAGFRIDDGGLGRPAWNWPLWTQQSDFIAKALGAKWVGDSGDRYGGPLNTATGGCGLMRSANGCRFVDDTGSTNPADWRLDDVGLTLLANIQKQKADGKEVVFVSWVQGEADAQAIPGLGSGAPYFFTSQEQWANHYKDVLKRMLSLLRERSGVPSLRMAVQLIANYGGATDLIRQAQIAAADESNGAIIIGNGNPWQYYRPLGSDYSHYDGQSYQEFCLETGRTIARAMAKAGLVDSLKGPTYGEFPRITGVTASGSTLDIAVSNPNGARTLILPGANPAQGFVVYANGVSVGVTGASLASPFVIRLALNASVVGKAVRVTYGTEGVRPAVGQAIVDDSAASAPAEPTGLARKNMPLMIKPL